jgi:hypothetical protein
MEEKIILEYLNKVPVELSDLTGALTSFGEQYRKFIITKPEIKNPSEAKLFIKEIRAGSIITELIPFTPLLLPIMTDINFVMSFCSNLKSCYELLVWFCQGFFSMSLVGA